MPQEDAPMTRYALLLRGVNVGKKNSLPMAELRAMLAAIGCVEVQTYVQSGNAVFGATHSASELTRRIETSLGAFMGRPIVTTSRTRAQLEAIVDGNPFKAEAATPANLCVTFLSHAPSDVELAPLLDRAWEPERFEVTGDVIYTWHPDGQGQSPLARALGKLRLMDDGAVTTRNWNTTLKLLAMLSAAP